MRLMVRPLLPNDERDRSESVALQAAHDIRSPLAALTVALSDLPQLPEEKRWLAQRALERIQEIANELLSRKASSGAWAWRSDERGERVELASLVRDVMAEKALQLRSSPRIRLAISCDQKQVFACVQRSQFRRMLSNLVNNAAEALAGHGLIEVALRSRNGRIFLRVRDSGKGIHRELRAMLRHRLEGRYRPCRRGYGLVHAGAVIRAWGGKVRIASRHGKGTVVRLTLPDAQFLETSPR